MNRSRVHFAWREPAAHCRFRTGVSLHSHTLHSHEGLEFIVKLGVSLPVVGVLIRRQLERYQRIHGGPLDLSGIWWTPPLAARAAYDLEAGQLRGLGLDPLVSLSDHDTIDAPLSLRVLEATRDVPVSVEWTVPWGDTFFHLGIHNLAPTRAQATMAEFAAFTANPQPAWLLELLDAVASDPATLVVFNHPCWDEKGIGAAPHRAWMRDLLTRCRTWIHAIELNGLRPFAENREAARLAEQYGLPAISGGDRHGTEPNATLNLTNAADFSEFAAEIRRDRWSDVLFTTHYAESLAVRVYRSVCDVLRDDPMHALGWTRWNDRVFWRHRGEAVPLSQAWPEGAPHVVEWFIALVRLLGNDRLAPALRGLGAAPREMAW